MKSKIIILFIISSITMSGTFACLPVPGSEGLLANKLLQSVAKKYNVNLLESEVQVEKYLHEMKWRFSNPGIDCHDTNIISADITIIYKDKWDIETQCQSKVRANIISSPDKKDAEYKINYQILEISHSCGDEIRGKRI